MSFSSGWQRGAEELVEKLNENKTKEMVNHGREGITPLAVKCKVWEQQIVMRKMTRPVGLMNFLDVAESSTIKDYKLSR